MELEEKERLNDQRDKERQNKQSEINCIDQFDPVNNPHTNNSIEGKFDQMIEKGQEMMNLKDTKTSNQMNETYLGMTTTQSAM